MSHPDRQSPQPQQFSTAELFAAVHALSPRVAVFDCDGTLWSGDAGSSFMWWSIETGLLSAERAATLRSRYDEYLAGSVSELAICGEMVQIYAGLDEAQLRSAAATFFREVIESQIFPELRTLIGQLHGSGVTLWAVSSTNNWVVVEGVRRFGIPPSHVLAACVAVEDGVVTSRLLDVPTDEGKVSALQRAGVSSPDAVFGNSVHDAAMLSIARQAFPVNPSAALRERAVTEGWSIYDPAGMTRPAPDKHE